MRKTLLLIPCLILLLMCSCEEAEKFFDLPLSEQEIAEGLKAALNEGVDESTTSASATDGYLKNELIKIFLPSEVAALQETIANGSVPVVGVKYSTIMDVYIAATPDIDQDPFEELITAMNRGAESAAQKASPIFVDAITSMSITDALAILQGGETSATEYFISKTRSQLIDSFQPDIKSALDQTQATTLYASIQGFLAYEYEVNLVVTTQTIAVKDYINQELPESIDGYATERAVEGLFYLIGEEEKKIRANPLDYASAIIQKVFGSDEAQTN
ncbi:Protein of unknown function [Reichenbachiella agariperforans]|uniref:DUF4197 domain-containing protein n=1 Tax=Reichenbachiella agariperforans TaxID=156994 RepID=A0A1M6SWU1_REIAG|nr:DUF4197 domain-containing protein [Reichenbachiella agariperforans]SHK49146.1 Protein of unknown function [Reichenbachiella agariperforans]